MQIRLLVLLTLSMTSAASAQLSCPFVQDGQLVIFNQSGEEVSLSGLSLESSEGRIVPSNEPAPFQFILGAATEHSISYGNLPPNETVIATGGTLTLSAGYEGMPWREISVTAGITGESVPVDLLCFPEPASQTSLLIGGLILLGAGRKRLRIR